MSVISKHMLSFKRFITLTSVLILSMVVLVAIAQPSITSISPASAKPGDVVTIVGARFSGTVAQTEVYFGNTKVTSYVSASTGTLRVNVPIGATYGPITVLDKVNKKYGTSTQFFSPIFSKPKGSFDANDMTVSNMFSTNKNPYSVAVGDVDGDGKPDAVVVNYDSNNVSVLRNTSTVGNINFATKVDFPTGVRPIAVALADMDNDAKLDIVVVNNASGNVSVLKNTSTSTGTVSFAARVNFTTGSAPTALAIADMNGDGFQDIVVTNGGSNTVSYFQSTSTTTAISFATKKDFATGTFPQAVAIADLDANGTLDIVVANSSDNTVSVLQNTTTGGVVSMAAKVDYAVSNGPQSVAIGDITGDGKLDVVATNYTNGYVSTLRNISISGTVTLSAAVNKFATYYAETVSITDIDADGKLDVLYANNASSFAVLRNTTTATAPTYALAVDFGTGSLTKAHALGDIDGDGKIDAVVITSYNDAIVVVRNNPVYSNNADLFAVTLSTGTLSPTFKSSITSYTASVPNATTSITVKPTKAQDSATLEIQLNGGGYTSITSGLSSSALSLNLGDNIINIRVTAQDGTIQIYTFTVTRVSPPTITSISPTSGSIGTTVTITGTFFNSTPANNVVFFGATQATVTASTATSLTVTVPVGATYAPITVLNKTSALSSASKQYFNTTYTPNKGSIDTADFTASAAFATNTNPNKVVIGDIDGDGKADAVVLDNSNPKFSVLRNTSTSGAINFDAKVDFTTLSSPRSITLGDINNDGKLDVIVVNLTDSVSVFRNTSTSGKISFAARVNILSGLAISTPTKCVVGDIDGDGKQDIVVNDIGLKQFSVLRNTSPSATNITFAFFTTVATGNNPSGIAIGDIDNDGKADIVTANANPANATGTAYYVVSVLRNTSTSGTVSFAAKTDFTVDGSPSFVALGDINGDGVNDIVTGNTSTNNISVLVNYSTAGNLAMNTVKNFTTGANAGVLGIADIDGDGKLDIAILPNSKGVAVLRNTSTSTNPNSMSFAAPATLAKATTYSNMAVADMDGDGKVDITVTNASAGNLTVLRSAPKLSSDNNLTNISITAGALSPVFDSLTLFYSINVRNYVASTTVTAIKNQDSAKIEIQYNSGVYTSFVSGSVSSSLPLNVGTNVINFKVTAQNGGVKIYTIVITRACFASPSTTNLAICPSQLPFTWNGTVFTAPSTQGVILTTANGCDSTATLVLSLKAATASTTNLSICSSELPYSWNGLTFTTAGSQTKTGLVNSQGCDSTATLNLTVKLATVSDTIRATINQGQSYTFNGTNYNTTGIYSIKLVNAAGCDSTAILSLTVIANHSVTGNIIHPTSAAVQRVSMNVNAVNTATVNTAGNYNLSLMPGFNYSIKPSKNNDSAKANGLTVIDAILVQSHILGNAIFNSPYKIIAADVNNSGDVSAIDIIFLKRLILGIDTTFKGNRLWAFVDSAYKFSDPSNPFPYKDSISFTNLSSNKTNQSFIGVKLGDVNYDWNNTIMSNHAATKPIELYYNNINLGREQEVVVPIRVKNFKEMIGMQYTLNFNSNALQLKSINNTALNLEYGTNHLNDGKISFLWNDAQLKPHSLTDGSVLFELVFTKLCSSIKEEDIALSSDISVIEAWDAMYQKHNIIKTAGKITNAPEFATKENWNVSPNPSNGEVKVDLSLTSNKTIHFRLTSVDGRLVYQKALEANSGNSSSKLNFGKQAKLAAGIYFLKVEGIEGVNVKQVEIK